jgi:uncharacterized C2H2 Zn-finger protein
LKGPYRCPRCDQIITIDATVWWTGERGQMTRCKRCGVTVYRDEDGILRQDPSDFPPPLAS